MLISHNLCHLQNFNELTLLRYHDSKIGYGNRVQYNSITLRNGIDTYKSEYQLTFGIQVFQFRTKNTKLF